ncbi:MAG TPA: PKD domain-containing protein [Solirubrobacterales bacterium]|nr:PKD domain-containing protein [Solirubrobacterales bacterium]
MNSQKSPLAKIAAIAIAFLLSFTVAATTAAAAERFLSGPVPVLPEPVDKSPFGGFEFAEAASGEAVAIWGEANSLRASVRLPGGGFQPSVEVVPNVFPSANPDLAIAPDGYTVLTWRQNDGDGVSQVMSAVRQPGAANFGPALQVSDESFDIPNIDPHVDVADDGVALLTWKGRDIEGDENSTRVRKRFLTGQGALDGAISDVSPVSANGVSTPQVFLGPNGHALITWVVGDTITGDPATCWMEPGGAGPDVQIFNTNSGSGLAGAVDAQGNAVVADRVGPDVIGNSRLAGPGQNFIFDQTLNLPGTTGFTPRLSMDENGAATVAFPYFGGGKEGIQTVERPAGGVQFFGTATKAIPESAGVSDVSLAVGGKGLVILGWTREDDRVYAASRDAGVPQFNVPTGPVSPAAATGVTAAGADALGKGMVLYSSLDVPSDDYSINALPYDDVPKADGLSIPSTAVTGQEVAFSVTPSDPWAAITGVEWEVDESVKKDGEQVTHTYATPGEQMVVLTLTDALGNKTTTGGLVTITAPPVDETAPKLSGLSMLKKKSKRGAKNAFRFTLSEKARVVITIKRVSKGKGKRAQGKIVRRKVAAGKRRIGFRGKVNKRGLVPARYKATIVAVDKAGNRSKKRHLSFRIVR